MSHGKFHQFKVKKREDDNFEQNGLRITKIEAKWREKLYF